MAVQYNPETGKTEIVSARGQSTFVPDANNPGQGEVVSNSGLPSTTDAHYAADLGAAAQDFTSKDQYGWGNFTPYAQQTMGSFYDIAGQYANQQAPQLQRVGIGFGGATGETLPAAPSGPPPIDINLPPPPSTGAIMGGNYTTPVGNVGGPAPAASSPPVPASGPSAPPAPATTAAPTPAPTPAPGPTNTLPSSTSSMGTVKMGGAAQPQPAPTPLPPTGSAGGNTMSGPTLGTVKPPTGPLETKSMQPSYAGGQLPTLGSVPKPAGPVATSTMGPQPTSQDIANGAKQIVANNPTGAAAVQNGASAIGAGTFNNAMSSGPTSRLPTGAPQAPPPGIPGTGEFSNPLFKQGQDTRGQQQQFLNTLQRDVAGGGPTAADAQLQMATDANRAALASSVASAGPQNYSAALRSGIMGAEQAGQTQALQNAVLKAQEHQAAVGAMGTAVNQQRISDLQATGMSYDNAVKQAQLEADQAKTQATLQEQQNALNMQGAQTMLGMGQQTGSADLGSRMHYEDLMAQKYANDRQLAQQASQFNTGESDKWLGAGISAAATLAPLLMMSDKRLKSNVAKASPRALRSMLRELKPSEFDYKKPERHGAGRRIGIMAQDLEKSRVGKMLVRDTPEGKGVDISNALGASLAALADQNARLDRLEGRTMGAAA